SNLPIGIYVYGFGNADGYSYNGGQSYAPIANVNTLTLSQIKTNYFISNQACVSAIVLDTNSSPLSGVRVDFEVESQPKQYGFAYTNSNGQADYCFTNNINGITRVIASIGTLNSNELIQNWNSPEIHCAPEQPVSCTQTGYYPTDFFSQYMNLIKEFMAADKNQLLIEGTQSLCCTTCYDLSSLPSYTEFFPYNVIGTNRDSWCVGNDDYFLDFREFFNEVLDSYDNTCIYYFLQSNIFRNYRELIWSVDPISGIISISIKDEFGNNVSYCDKESFEINAKDYTYSQQENNNFNHCSQNFIQNGYCCEVGDVNKTLITPIQYLECPDVTPPPCVECIPRFMLEPGKTYVLSAWVMQSDWQDNYTLTYPQIQLSFRDGGVIEPFSAHGPIIDGWQRIEEEFTVPSTATDITVTLMNTGNVDVFF